MGAKLSGFIIIVLHKGVENKTSLTLLTNPFRAKVVYSV